MALELSKRLLIEDVDVPKNAVWFHTASVGEFNSIRFLIDHISRKFPVFITYFSPRSYHFFKSLHYKAFPLPLDLPFIWDKFLKQKNPCCLINVEKEFWPFLLKAKIPKAILNARKPKNALERYLLRFFDMIIAKDEPGFELLKDINKNTFLCGNLKLSIDLNCENLEKDSVVIGSTHEKEEELLIDLVRWLLENTGYNVILAPRHINRAYDVLGLLRKYGIDAHLKTEDTPSRVIVLDTLGELKEYYKRATVSIVGGSFVKGYGGHNIVEPVNVCSYVLYGPYIEKISDVAEILEKAGVGLRVHASNIVDAVKYTLEHPLSVDKLLSLSSYSKDVRSCYIELVEKFVLEQRRP